MKSNLVIVHAFLNDPKYFNVHSLGLESIVREFSIELGQD